MPAVIAALLVMTLLVSACGTETVSESNDAQATTDENVPLSLEPAADDATPNAVPSAVALPSGGPPSGDPGKPIEPPSEYLLGADDLVAFADAYRQAYADMAGASDDELDVVGTHLCTYLLRHADQQGNVDAEGALTEADLNQPGYARADWLLALELANMYYCSEMTVDFDSAGG